MLSKRGKGYDPSQVPAEKRLRLNLGDAFLGNEITGQRAQELYNDAQAAGAANVRDLATAATGRNACRNLRSKLLKGSKWPKIYEASIRMKNPKTEEAGAEH